MPVIYSDKLIFYREDSSERNILANTLTKSDEWIHEREWRIVIKDDINIGKSGIIKDFVLPREIYIGCRQQETVAENNNNRMLHNKKENEMYADLDEILQWAENNYIDVYMPSVNAGNNILCLHEPEAPKELDGGDFWVKVVIPARLKNVIMKQLEEKGITKEALLPM